jgi:hypothetical protein
MVLWPEYTMGICAKSSERRQDRLLCRHAARAFYLTPGAPLPEQLGIDPDRSSNFGLLVKPFRAGKRAACIILIHFLKQLKIAWRRKRKATKANKARRKSMK